MQILRAGRGILSLGDIAPLGGGGTTRYTLTLSPSADTSLTENAPTLNLGRSSLILLSGAGSSHRKGLLRFDCSVIPTNATCISATLTLTLVTVTTVNGTVTLYSVATANSVWIEGTKNNTLAGAGEPCWNALAADGAGGVTTAWAGSAGLSTINTDYESAALGSFSILTTHAVGTAYATSLTPARIQSWFGAVNTNYGLLVTFNAAAFPNLATKEHATIAYRPKLVVVYDA